MGPPGAAREAPIARRHRRGGDDGSGGGGNGGGGVGGGGEGGSGGGEGGLGLLMHTMLTSSKAMSPVKLLPRSPSNVKPAVGTDADALPQAWPWFPDFVHTVLPDVLFSLSDPMVAPYMLYHQLTITRSPCGQT